MSLISQVTFLDMYYISSLFYIMLKLRIKMNMSKIVESLLHNYAVNLMLLIREKPGGSYHFKSPLEAETKWLPFLQSFTYLHFKMYLSKQVVPNQEYKLLHSKGNRKLNEKTT